MSKQMHTGALFSRDFKYRFLLWRIWEEDKPRVLFIGLNPSTARGDKNDPTIRRCIDFAQRWGYGGMYVSNLFSYRTPYPKELLTVKDPVHADNDNFLSHYQDQCDLTVLIWGNWGQLMNRDQKVLPLIKTPYCLQITKRGAPAHLLYLRKNLQPIRFE